MVHAVGTEKKINNTYRNKRFCNLKVKTEEEQKIKIISV